MRLGFWLSFLCFRHGGFEAEANKIPRCVGSFVEYDDAGNVCGMCALGVIAAAFYPDRKLHKNSNWAYDIAQDELFMSSGSIWGPSDRGYSFSKISERSFGCWRL